MGRALRGTDGRVRSTWMLSGVAGLLAVAMLSGCSGSAGEGVAEAAGDEPTATTGEASPSDTTVVRPVIAEDLIVAPPTKDLSVVPGQDKPEVLTPDNLAEARAFLGPDWVKQELKSWRQTGVVRQVEQSFDGRGGSGLSSGGISISIFEETPVMHPPYEGDFYTSEAVTAPDVPAGLTAECRQLNLTSGAEGPMSHRTDCDFLWPDQKMRISVGVAGPDADKVTTTLLEWAQEVLENLPAT